MLFDGTQKTRFITEISKDDQWKESNIYCKNFTRFFKIDTLKISAPFYIETVGI